MEKPIKKLYYKISEVSELLNISPHLVRGWGDRFGIPFGYNKAGHRTYTEVEILKLKYVHFLAYRRGLTQDGVLLELRLGGWPTESELSEMIRKFNVACMMAVK